MSDQTPNFSYRMPLDIRRKLDELSVIKNESVSKLMSDILREKLQIEETKK